MERNPSFTRGVRMFTRRTTHSFLDSVKKKYPNSSIDFLIKKEFSPLLQNHPQINNVIELDKSEGLKGLVSLGKHLMHQGYYKVFDIHNVFRSKILSFFFKRKIFFQIKKPRLKRFMLFNLKLNFFKKDFSHIKMYHSILEDIHSFRILILDQLLIVLKVESDLNHSIFYTLA